MATYGRYDLIPTNINNFIVFAPTGLNFLQFAGATHRDSVAQYEQYAASLSDIARNFSEVIVGTRDHKLALDLDFDEPMPRARSFECACNWFRSCCDRIVDAARDTYFDMFNDTIMPNDIIICESIDAREDSRLSAHIIITRLVPHYTIAREFAHRIAERLDDEESALIDRAIYATKHNLRILGCVKPGSIRVKKIRNRVCSLWDTLVTTLCPVAPAIMCAQLYEDYGSKLCEHEHEYDMDISITNHARVLCDNAHGPGIHRIRSATGSLILFDRLQPSYCTICNRTHDHDNTVMICVSEQNGSTVYTEYCRKNNSTERRILDTVNNDIAEELQQVQPLLQDQQYVNSVEQYDEPRMRPYPREPRTLFVHAPMKIGKTKELRHYVNDILDGDAHALFVSFRRAFTNAIATQFDDFTSYMTIQGELCCNRMIVQVESLNRIVPERWGAPALLVLDEIESIIEQLNSGLSANQMMNFAVFQWLLRMSERVIILDAHISERTYAIVARIRGTEGSYLVHNINQNASDWNYYFTSFVPLWLCTIDECLSQNKRIVICANNANEGHILRKMLETKLRGSARTVQMYCAETNARLKADSFADVNASWSKCDVLIYTPTITAGVSFEVAHFDYIFGYFTDESCCAQTCIQMMGRIRGISQKRAFICIKASRSVFPETRDDLILALRLRKDMIIDTRSPFVIEFDDHGLPTIPDTDYAELCIQNLIVRNRSRNNITRELIRLIQPTGAKCEQLSKAIFATLFARELSVNAISDMNIMHQDTACDCIESNALRIVNAHDIVGEEYMKFQERSLITLDTTDTAEYDETIASMRKYELRELYQMHNCDITATFVKTFGPRYIMNAFSNVRLLYAVSKREGNVERALIAMRAVERAGMNSEELNFPYSYSAHRVVNLCVRIIGFTDVFDRNVVLRRDVESNIIQQRGVIRSIIPTLNHQFGLPSPRRQRHQDNDDFIVIATHVLMKMYAIVIVRVDEIYKLEMTKIFAIYPHGIAPAFEFI
jgi:hypothetical protein